MKKKKKKIEERITDLQARINAKYKDCIDAEYALDITADIASGVTLEEIEDCLKSNDNCADFRRCLEGKKFL